MTCSRSASNRSDWRWQWLSTSRIRPRSYAARLRRRSAGVLPQPDLVALAVVDRGVAALARDVGRRREDLAAVGLGRGDRVLELVHGDVDPDDRPDGLVAPAEAATVGLLGPEEVVVREL